MGIRKLYFYMQPHMGRDKFEVLCKENNLQIKQHKQGKRTTNSLGVSRFQNLVEHLKPSKINEVWSSDITYYQVGQRFYYITFIMDNYSRLILGYQVSKRLKTEQTTLPALKAAISLRKRRIPKGMIFHSDEGGQYYDKAFLKLTLKYGIQNSMCSYAYENGYAERLNGIIKNEYLKPWGVKTYEDLQKKVDRAVSLYNSERPHNSLGRISPNEFERNIRTLDIQNSMPEVPLALNH